MPLKPIINLMSFRDITIEVTNQCNLKCRMCGIWKERKKILPAKAITSFINSLFGRSYKISSVSVTGGEPFLHPEFQAIFNFLSLLKIKRKIRSFGIYSNGYAYKLIKKFLEANYRYINGLTIGISLDGLKKEHDILRGKRDAFANTVKTVKYIQKRFNGAVKLEIKFTISCVNYLQIFDMYRFCRQHNACFVPKFVEFSVGNYYHRDGSSVPKNIWINDPGVRNSIEGQFAKVFSEEKKTGYRYINKGLFLGLRRILECGEGFISSCMTPSRCLFITSQGLIYPCLYDKAIGTVGDRGRSLRSLRSLFNARHKKIISKGLRGKCVKCFAYHGFLKDFNIEVNYSRSLQ